MSGSVPIIEFWRGEMLESQHRGFAVVCDTSGQIVEAWGDPDKMIFPRSACKMIQALPLVESGAADGNGLTTEQLALSCASHIGSAIHTDRVAAWLDQLDLTDDDFRCGAHEPYDPAVRDHLMCSSTAPCQAHNNCSGKHSGFLTLNKWMNGHADYIELDHPVQQACLEATERMTGITSPGHGIDGCSAPNFATSMTGLARAMSLFAGASDQSAAGRLRDAMRMHPELVAGEGKACTELMRALDHKVTIKTGAEGVYIAILPEQGLGIALKAEDGATRASEAAITALLAKYAGLPLDHPMAKKRLGGPILNCRGTNTATSKIAPGFA